MLKLYVSFANFKQNFKSDNLSHKRKWQAICKDVCDKAKKQVE